MKKLYTFLFSVCSCFLWAGQIAPQHDALPENNFSAYFEKAYSEHPGIPKGILEAVAYTNSRFHHIEHNPGGAESCMGLPKYYGVMGLVQDGKNYFRNNLNYISQISGYSTDDIISSPEKNILAYAKAYASLYSMFDNVNPIRIRESFSEGMPSPSTPRHSMKEDMKMKIKIMYI